MFPAWPITHPFGNAFAVTGVDATLAVFGGGPNTLVFGHAKDAAVLGVDAKPAAVPGVDAKPAEVPEVDAEPTAVSGVDATLAAVSGVDATVSSASGVDAKPEPKPNNFSNAQSRALPRDTFIAYSII